MRSDVSRSGPRAAVKERMSRSDVSARLHARAFRSSRGRIGAVVDGRDVLLLETIGRRSGDPRHVVVMFVREHGRFLVVPSNAAAPDRPPAWWLNLRAQPEARTLVDGRWHRVRAEELSPAQREEWWPRMLEHNPNWGRFQEETARRFPIVALIQCDRR